MTQIVDATVFKDRKGWLVFFGVAEILMGLVCLLLLVVMLLASALAARSGAPGVAIPLRGLIGAVIGYGLLGMFFITMGIGSILARRWARAIMLMVSTLWLVFGTVSIFMVLSLLPQMFNTPAMSGEQVSPGFAMVFKAIMVLFMIVFYVIVPGVLFLFYRSPHVKATCEQRDPVPRWTDRSLPVLSLALLAGLMAILMVVMLFVNLVPFFGLILTGASAMLYEVISGVVAAWAAWHLYHERMQGWVAITALSVMGMLSWVVTLMRGDILEIYRLYGMSPEELQRMSSVVQGFKSPAYLLATLFSAFVWGGYLWWVRKELLAIRAAE